MGRRVVVAEADIMVLRLQPDIAVAAIAATAATYAAVVRAGIFGAKNADLGGSLGADAADERSGFYHLVFLEVDWFRTPRQR